MEQLSSNKTIAKNTIFLYLRMMANLAIGLFTSRVILQTLGISDYGLYGVVGGIVAMFGFLNATMAGATSRFLSYEMGAGDKQDLKFTFSSALFLHIAIALMITLICETFGVWFLENKLVIPDGRLHAARWVLQFSILSTLFQIIQVPFNAAIISHERMGIYAYVEIANSVLRLLILYLLVIGDVDKLILYSILTFVVSVFINAFYVFYSIRTFEECTFRLIWRKNIVYKMLSFTGWSLYGNLSLMVITQGINMLMNIFFGTIMNAAYDISNRVKGLVMTLSANFTVAMRPQIVKAYSADNYVRTYSLMCNSMRITFSLMLIICAPLLIETHFVLRIWLGVVPDYAVTLLRLSLMWNIIVSLSTGYADVANATGDNKMMSLFAGTLYLSVFPITYMSYKFGASYWFPFALNVVTVLLAPFYTCYTIKKHLPGFSWKVHVFRDLSRCFIILIAVLCISYYSTTQMSESFMRLSITTCISSLTTCTLAFFYLFPHLLRKKIINIIREKLKHVYNEM